MTHQPDKPVEGFFQMRLVKAGPFVPVRIWYGPSFDPATGEYCDRSHFWRAAIDGVQVSIWRAWPACSGRPITEAEYRFMRATAQHAKRWEPSMPEAHPRDPIDLNALPPLTFRG